MKRINHIFSDPNIADSTPLYHDILKQHGNELSTFGSEILSRIQSHSNFDFSTLPEDIYYIDKYDEKPKLKDASASLFNSKIESQDSVESEESYLEEMELPTTLYFTKLKNYPCVKFDRTLTLVEKYHKRNVGNTEEGPSELTPIPKFIGFLILALRRKFEEELKENVCFLEAKYFPSNKNVVKLAKLVYYFSSDQSKVDKVTEHASGILIFCTLLDLLQRFEHKLLQFSYDLCRLSQNDKVMQPCNPFDFVILKQLNSYIDNVYLKAPGVVKKKKRVKFKNPALKPIKNMIGRYYQQKNRSLNTDIILRNRLHTVLYRDFRSTKTTMQRYLMKFVLRSAIYFVRRYICSVSSRLRLLRKESWNMAVQTCVPQIRTFAVNRMAQFLAFSISEIQGPIDTYQMRVDMLKDILVVHLDTVFGRQKLVSNLITNTESVMCHQDCICGLG